MKFYLQQVNAETTPNQNNLLNSLNNTNLRTLSNGNSESGKPELIYNVNSTSEPLYVIKIKNFISQNTNTRIENISIFTNHNKDQDTNYGLFDEFDIFRLFDNKTISSKLIKNNGTFLTFNSNNNREHIPTLYYRILNDIPLVKIIIEYFLTNIDKILIEVSSNCSIYILKSLLSQKLHIPENEQNLIDLNTQKPFKNDEIIGNIINPNIDNSIRLNNSQINNSTSSVHKENDAINTLNRSVSEFNLRESGKFLKIQLIRKGKRTCSIGIDFSFNILKDIKKIEFCENAPSFREATDGLNIFCYCKNKSCKIIDELFVVNLGIILTIV